MAIKIPILQALSKELETKSYVYKDVQLDLVKDQAFNKNIEQNLNLNDIKVSYNREAIYNSLRNLFTTQQGERFLFPLYGLDLRRFLFEPITSVTGESIGQAITYGIKAFEPRVVLKKCLVAANEDENQYNIDIIVSIPAFDDQTTISSILNVKTQRFTFLT